MKSSHKLIANYLLGFSLIVTILTGCSNDTASDTTVSKSDSTKAAAAFASIKTDTIKVLPIREIINLTGKVTFNQDEVVKVFPLVGGHIEDVRVELGDYVKKGQVLAVIRSGDLVDLQQQEIAARSSLSVAKKNLQVSEDMTNSGLSSQKELVASKEQVETSKAEVNRVAQRKKILGASGSTYTIKAPNSGFIVEKNAATGMELRSDDLENLFTISNLDKVWIMVNVYESDIAKIRLGQEAKITTISYPDKVYSGKNDKVFNTLDPLNKTEKARIQLPNADFQLKPEMFANIIVEYGGNETGLAVNSKAVIFDNNQNYVLIKSGNGIAAKVITINKVVGDKTFIKSGLDAGQLAVVENQLTLFQTLKN